ncbi:Nucleic acid dioxygenase alkbh1 [Desmophyllum pertusum]|uniref:Nucleic acid dioxygenase alkbh1 n=1 Tax=Desmophyllum pertusum TaxID=174260 RepID=A0A9W9Z4V4_9CNID|nr:Nucleic acid dioxygenase alkbh1 [Desmophyllum pertusum]
MDSFKREFKRYKQRQPPPDLSEVIDFTQPEAVPFKKWNGVFYGIHGHPGFVFIVNPFNPGAQWQWVEKCIKDYPCQPNICNLDAHVDRTGTDTIWNQSMSDESSCLEKSLLYKLRWVTLGYHYDWDSKTYSKTRHTEFPPDLGKLIEFIATALQFPRLTAISLILSALKPEAAIINYYHLDSTLSGHTDHSELDLTAPLFSLSFGQSAIFLLGGKTREQAPLAMYLRSGDIMIMAVNSRLAYHAVPRILAPPKHASEAALPACLLRGEVDTKGDCIEK